MRWAAAVALLCLAAALLAGCSGRPPAAGAEPDRPSIPSERGEIAGELLGLEGRMHVSPIPGEAAALADGDEPYGCFVVDDADDEDASFLGGLVLDLEWDAVADGAQVLNVTIDGWDDYGFWQVEGPSPLHLVLDEEATLGQPVRTPLAITVAQPTGTLPVLDQPVAWKVTVGVLESRIDALQWVPCSDSLLDQ